MTTLTFDTHAFYTELVESGLAEKTADALTKAVTKIEQAKIEELATKHDLKELEIITKRDIRESELRLELKIEQAKADLTRWVITVGILQVTVIAALIMRLTGHA